MTKPVMLDTGPLGGISHPRAKREIAEWLQEAMRSGVTVIIPEIADYEVRRELIRSGKSKGIQRLDRLKQFLVYQPLNTPAMLDAAQLWADARQRGSPTADPKELDGDAILAAQALQAGAVVATENVGHLSQFVEAKHWRDIHFGADST